jgi:hypothetical protein
MVSPPNERARRVGRRARKTDHLCGLINPQITPPISSYKGRLDLRRKWGTAVRNSLQSRRHKTFRAANHSPVGKTARVPTCRSCLDELAENPDAELPSMRRRASAVLRDEFAKQRQQVMAD